MSTLNNRSELISNCRHSKKFLLDSKDSANDLANEVRSQEHDQEKSLAKRDLQLSPDHVPVDNKLEMLRNYNVVSHNIGNQTNLQDEVRRQVSQDLPESRGHSFDKQTNSNNSNPLGDESPKVEESIKIRDLKSNVREGVRQTSSLSSRSMKSFLSKQKIKRSRRSRLQVSEHLLCEVVSVPRTADGIF